jgi:hypothetical protein
MTRRKIYIEHGPFLKPVYGDFDLIIAIIPDYNLFLYHRNKNNKDLILLDTGDTFENVIDSIKHDKLTVCLRHEPTWKKDLQIIESKQIKIQGLPTQSPIRSGRQTHEACPPEYFPPPVDSLSWSDRTACSQTTPEQSPRYTSPCYRTGN